MSCLNYRVMHGGNADGIVDDVAEDVDVVSDIPFWFQ